MACYRTGSVWRWPGGKIPYVIDGDDFPNDGDHASERAAIMAAMDDWAAATPITFHRRKAGETHYIRFVAGTELTACNSKVGMQQSAQKVYCNPLTGNLPHELGHAIGLWHEQSREDRDTFVTVVRANVRSDKVGNFNKHVSDGTDFGPYDYNSLMHYTTREFAIDWTPADQIPAQTTGRAPALATMGSELHLVHSGETSNRLYHSWWTPLDGWEPNREIPGQTSKASPAVCRWNGGLHLVHLGDSSNTLWYSWSDDLRNWTENVPVGRQKSKATPALTAFHGELHMVHLGDSTNDLWHSWTADGAHWTEQRIPGQQSKATPALSVLDDQLHLVHLGDTSNDLWHSFTTDGRSWTTNARIDDQESRNTPALADLGPTLHLAHTGTSSTTMWHSTYSQSGGWRPNNRKDNNHSSVAPALAAAPTPDGSGLTLHQVVKGASTTRLWHSVRDTTLPVLILPPGVILAGNGLPSDGDIAAIKHMYA